MTPFRSTNSPAKLKPQSLLSPIARGAAALSLAGMMTLTAIAGHHGAVAQTESVGVSAAAVAPANTLLYVGFDLDFDSPQWVLANELLTRAGADETGSDILGDASEDATGQFSIDDEAFLGGEGAFVVTSLESFDDEASSLTDMIGSVSIPTADDMSEISTGAEGGGWAFILEPSDIASATSQLEAEIASATDVTVTETEYNGATIWSAPANDVTGDSAFAYAIVDDFVIVAEFPADIEPFVDTAAGAGDALGDLDAFNQASDVLAGDRMAFGYLDSTSLGDDVDALDTSGLGLGESLTDLTGEPMYTGMSLIADPLGFRFETVQIPADGAATTAAATPSNDNPTFAEDVPADALVMATGYDLGAGVLLQGLGLALVTGVNQGLSSSGFAEEEATPVAIPSADELYEQTAALLGFNLKTGFIDQMTGQYGFALWGSDFDDPAQVGAILTSGVAEPATLADTLSKLSFLIQAGAQGEANVTTRAVGDYNINTVTVVQDGADPIVVEYGIVDGQFVLGFGNGVDAYMNSEGDSLAENADYQTAMGALPESHTGVLYVNIPQAIAIEAASSASDDAAFVDDPELCGQYSTQAAAQEAYDADPVENFEMDWDFDGIACENFYDVATPAATPVASAPDSPVRAFAGVSYEEDGLTRTSSIVLIDAE